MSKPPPPAPTASAIGPCPTVIKIVGRPGTGSLPSTIAPPDHPRTNRRLSICNPTIQLVVVDLYTKYEVSILNGCGDIFDEKVLRNHGRTDGTTDRCKPVYPPLFQSGGIIIEYMSIKDGLWCRVCATMDAFR